MARQRGNRWQADGLVAGKRVRRSFGTEAEADRWKALNQAAAGPVAAIGEASGVQTLSSFACRLEVNLWGRGDQAVVAMRHVREAVSILGDLPIDVIKTATVERLFDAYVQMGNGDATINRKYASLSKLCRHAVKTDLLPRMPEFARRKEPKGRERFLSYEEEDVIFAHLKGISNSAYDLCVLLVDSGCRLAEALTLRWKQVNFEATMPDADGNRVEVGTITLDVTKADVTRTVFMTDRMRALLVARRHQAQPFSDCNRWTFRDHWQRARKAAGFEHDPDVVPHILRHTCASRIVQGGLSLKVAQTQLGHKHAAMTNRYSHLVTDALSGVVGALQRPVRA